MIQGSGRYGADTSIKMTQILRKSGIGCELHPLFARIALRTSKSRNLCHSLLPAKRDFMRYRTAQTHTAAISAPAMTSVGQWTNRYSLEKATNAARTRMTAPYLLSKQRTENARAKALAVCPEGNE